MNPLPLLPFVLLLSSCTAAAHGSEARPPRGHLVIVGGGGTPDAVVEKAIALAGGRSGHAVILAQASSRPEAGEESVAYWKEKGLGSVESLDLSDAAAARKAIESADLIWFPGGDQSRLMSALEGTDLAEAIRARYAAGAVVGGTSAGAAVMSPLMIVGGETADLTIVRSGTVATAKGLGLFPGAIVDQHFLKRQRFDRLLSAVCDHPDLVGVGIDEKTAIIVSGSTFEVLGESGVLVLDARAAAVSAAEKGAPAAAAAVRLALLRSGMSYDLAARSTR
jgi:cyanophycinase